MKRMIVLLVVITLALLNALSACSSGPNEAACEAAWDQLNVGQNANANALDYGSYQKYQEAFEAEVNSVVGMLMNQDFAPDTVGYTAKECIKNGWDYRAASGISN